MRAMVALVFVLVGCGPTWGNPDEDGDPSEAALTHWRATTGPVSEACAERARATEFIEATNARVAYECDQQAAGCVIQYDADRSVVVMREGERPTNTPRHEVLHVISRCVTGDFDAQHSGAAFAD